MEPETTASPPTVPGTTASATPLEHPTQERITRVRTLRSCISCRQRKVKCDKARPCGACVKSSFQCVFPEQRRRPPRPRQPDAALVGRLARLEGVIEELSKSTGTNAAQLLADPGPFAAAKAEAADGGAGVPEIDTSLGQLLISEDKSRYIAPGFWASVTEEVEDLKDLLAEEERLDDISFFSPSTSFFFRSAPEDLSLLHPQLDDARFLYQNYLHAVDPLVRIIHKPTFELQFSQFLRDRGSQPPSKGFEALVFAMYFSSVTSMHPDAVYARYGVPKLDLQARYRTATEQALSNAGFLQSKRLTTLQALVLFCSVLREPEETRSSWSLIGLAIRIAQSLGLHRDGSLFGVSPIEVEMRRRLWYEILVLDVRTAEEHGTEPSISETSYDTLKPLNVNDIDLRNGIDPATLVRPNVFTETTFGLMRFPLLRIFRILLSMTPGPDKKKTMEEKSNLINETEAYVTKNYCTGLDPAQPMQACCGLICKLMTAKARLFLYHPYRHYRNGELLHGDVKDKLFLHAITCLELSIELATHATSQQWNWFFRSFHQPHACALILLELGARPPSELVGRAWQAIEIFMEHPDLYHTGSADTSEKYWRPLRKLKERAMRNRASSKSPPVAHSALYAGSNNGSTGSFVGPLEDSPIDWNEWDQVFQFGAEGGDTHMMGSVPLQFSP